MIKLPAFYKNNKKNTIYYAERIGINCTNEQDGQIMVIYYPASNNLIVDFKKTCMREINEFIDKFSLYEDVL